MHAGKGLRESVTELFVCLCYLLITFVKQNVGTDLDPNCLTLWLYTLKNMF